MTAVLVAVGGATLTVAVVGMRAGIEPFATWFYSFAWYSVLLMTDGVVARRDGRFFFLDRPGLALSLFGWSIPFWLVFELLNFRLANWYYVFVPDGATARWIGIAISFATVLPAIFLSERALRVYGPWREFSAVDGRRPPAGPGTRPRIGPRTLAALQAAGLLCLILPLVGPRFFFPLVWVGVTLIADLWVYRRDPERSLLHDLESRRLRRPVRLLVGGMAIGLLWELFNASARGKWIYTVPGLEDLKLFEMPVLGFFGFPFLALEGWSAYQALVVAGLAADPRRPSDYPAGDRPGAPRPGWVLAAAGLAALFSALVLRGMETGTISSTTPRLEAIDDPAARALGGSGYDVFDIADADPAELALAAGIGTERAADWIEWARLVTLRGIGVGNAARLRALGVTSLEELAAASADELTVRLAETGPPVRPARVRVWVRAAREAVQREAAGGVASRRGP
jgi:predicted flap endonuclease-1-like 5' DNA nuclease